MQPAQARGEPQQSVVVAPGLALVPPLSVERVSDAQLVRVQLQLRSRAEYRRAIVRADDGAFALLHYATRRNATTQTKGFVAHESEPWIDSHRSR